MPPHISDSHEWSSCCWVTLVLLNVEALITHLKMCNNPQQRGWEGHSGRERGCVCVCVCARARERYCILNALQGCPRAYQDSIPATISRHCMQRGEF